ncbi:MAG TPA: hypothetical protein VG013_17260, partial [Gemmataceae bacterium]|nr:hypothetical protein [Gemmataceae bacterium]
MHFGPLVFHSRWLIEQRQQVGPQQSALTESLLKMSGHLHLIRNDSLANLSQGVFGVFHKAILPWPTRKSYLLANCPAAAQHQG